MNTSPAALLASAQAAAQAATTALFQTLHRHQSPQLGEALF